MGFSDKLFVRAVEQVYLIKCRWMYAAFLSRNIHAFISKMMQNHIPPYLQRFKWAGPWTDLPAVQIQSKCLVQVVHKADKNNRWRILEAYCLKWNISQWKRKNSYFFSFIFYFTTFNPFQASGFVFGFLAFLWFCGFLKFISVLVYLAYVFVLIKVIW